MPTTTEEMPITMSDTLPFTHERTVRAASHPKPVAAKTSKMC